MTLLIAGALCIKSLLPEEDRSYCKNLWRNCYTTPAGLGDPLTKKDSVEPYYNTVTLPVGRMDNILVKIVHACVQDSLS